LYSNNLAKGVQLVQPVTSMICLTVPNNELLQTIKLDQVFTRGCTDKSAQRTRQTTNQVFTRGRTDRSAQRTRQTTNHVFTRGRTDQSAQRTRQTTKSTSGRNVT